MSAHKIKWAVDPEPTGRYRSFERRAWPSASYFNFEGKEGPTAARITCDKEYDPRDIKRGEVFELTLRIADHSKSPWVWVRAKKKCATVKECKELLKAILADNPQLMPKEV